MRDNAGSPALREVIAMNPDLNPVWHPWLREGHHGGARALQDPALNLYNGREWSVDLGQVCRLSDEYWHAALSMPMDDRIHGQRSAAFMALCREITTRRLEQSHSDGA
jgi:hypothetical protein